MITVTLIKVLELIFLVYEKITSIFNDTILGLIPDGVSTAIFQSVAYYKLALQIFPPMVLPTILFGIIIVIELILVIVKALPFVGKTVQD